MEACRYVEFTGVELVGGMELAALMDEAATCPVGKAAAGRFGGEEEPRVGEGRSGARWRCRPAAGAWTP
jgi:hypothetical protein